MPATPIPSSIRKRIRGRLAAVYGTDDVVESTAEAVETLIEEWRPQIFSRSGGWTEADAFLITYGDTLLPAADEAPLDLLRKFLTGRARDAFSLVHVLPFFPSTSDHGFSVVDYRQVDPALGAWTDLAALAEDHRVVFDCVLNHVSQESRYVTGHLAGDPAFAGFCIERDDAFDASQVTRPRQLPLFHDFERPGHSSVDLWTTFSRDQVDLNFANPAVLVELLGVLLFYASRGASMIRLDAIPYLWKESGTTCIHLPETHEIIRLIRAVFDAAAPHVILLSETNVPHRENISYFGGPERDEAQVIYNFSLAPLLLHTLHRQDASALSQWAGRLDDFGAHCTYLNITATHDGIGVRPAEDILAPADREALVQLAEDHGGHVNYKRNADGSSTAYELNITWFDAVNDPRASTDENAAEEIRRFLLSQAIPLALKGIPGLYVHSLLGSRNFLGDIDPAEPTTYRSINRARIPIDELEKALDDPASRRHRVFSALLQLLQLRRQHAAFHPDSAQRVLDLGPSLFAIERHDPASGSRITAVFNVTGTSHPFSLDGPEAESWHDLVRDEILGKGEISLDPWDFRWLMARSSVS